ncbi:hypothetical protein BAUCODRAFT_146595 [Baudoinia panamericana UAMH 10762]|uniref:SET domain-containing protein n=1 Tax=Baudoinia panamericana (strain UAMH 10762) TaxID=717646 RepID=M2NGA6_BAUPA|nr:uncharacterized protein BAUCODRAFT_146595 [Baudoinia panamericana UAMH 10762]EMC98000.1 hypothetical protein BAUCODRAFT_146595 [Baudoinia panamericana UAMH 10762]
MSAIARGTALEQWFKANGGHLHPSIRLDYNEQSGFLWRAREPIPPQEIASSVPYSLSLSYINALVDDAYPVFKQRRTDFTIEAIGFFYLMTQYLNKEQSFWKPYLDVLPSPSEFSTPLWFDAPADLAWLDGTDVLHTMLARREVYAQYYQSGLKVLSESGIDVTLYTWDLFRWAITTFTSRSFTSRVLLPQNRKYWPVHRTSTNGRRQTVLLDMSHSPAEDLDFSVLFPGLDSGNHDPNAQVDWSFDANQFSIALVQPIEAGAEVCNNYGPKANDELLMGYGFCIPNNPRDEVLLTLKAPPEALQVELKRIHPGYFTSSGQWSGEKATFRLQSPRAYSQESVGHVIQQLPRGLLELLYCILRHERGLPIIGSEESIKEFTDAPDGERYFPHIARMIVQSLVPKLQRLDAVALPEKPANNRQRQASIYRESQREILQTVIEALRISTRSLLKTPEEPGSRLVTFEGLIELWSARNGSEVVTPFIAGVQAITGTADAETLREAGWEDDLFVLLMCYIYRAATAYISSTGSGESDYGWFFDALPEYIDARASPKPSGTDEQERLERAEALMPLIAQAANGNYAADSFWESSDWKAEWVAEVGGKMLQYESMTMMVPRQDGGVEEARTVVYLHSNES